MTDIAFLCVNKRDMSYRLLSSFVSKDNAVINSLQKTKHLVPTPLSLVRLLVVYGWCSWWSTHTLLLSPGKTLNALNRVKTEKESMIQSSFSFAVLKKKKKNLDCHLEVKQSKSSVVSTLWSFCDTMISIYTC